MKSYARVYYYGEEIKYLNLSTISINKMNSLITESQ